LRKRGEMLAVNENRKKIELRGKSHQKEGVPKVSSLCSKEKRKSLSSGARERKDPKREKKSQKTKRCLGL